MHERSIRILASASLAVIAMLQCSPALAQEAPRPAPEAKSDEAVSSEDIVVTGSRAITNGDKAPTPLTVLSSDQLSLAAPSTITDALATVPQFRGASGRPATSVSPQSPSFATLNLRGLSDGSAARTLVLLDGRRVTPVTASGIVDINALPNLLVSRIDIVTGGASASYGSDAVAGVVNYVLDKKFTGLKADFNAGISGRGDDGSQKVALAGGANLLDGKLHVMGSFEYFNSDGLASGGGRKWMNKHCGIISNPTYPASGTNFLFRCGVVGTESAPGGVIPSGPLKGTQFLSGGVPAPFTYGTDLTSSTMVGGSGVWVDRGNIAAAIKTTLLYGRADYEVADNLTISAEGSYAKNDNSFNGVTPLFFGATDFTITADNPFIPAAVKAALAPGSSFKLGRASIDWGPSFQRNRDDTLSGTLGFDWRVDGNWVVSGYAQYGRTKIDQVVDNQVNRSRVYEAADAVINPATGQIVCRSTLTNPGNGCSPLNLFGPGSASSAALSYIMGTSWTKRTTSQTAAELSVRGSPFSTWAGKVQVAVGADYRRLTAEYVSDPLSNAKIVAAPGSQGTPAGIIGTVGGWLTGNQVTQPKASYDTKEVFGEVAVPLAADAPFARSLDAVGAVRYTDYSTAGGVVSWKLGLTYRPIEDIMLRGSISRDQRAPNISELYLPGSISLGSIFDPVTNSTYAISASSGGNPNLRPETARNVTAGIVITPRFIPRLSLAIDYYDIKLRGAIGVLSAQQIVNLCAGGNTSYCANITRLNGTGQITAINATRQNMAQIRSSGVDFELNYAVPVAKGTLSFRALASYLSRLTRTDPFGNVTVYDGVTGGEGGTFGDGSPKWQGTASVTYSDDAWTFFVQERLISSGTFDTLGTLYNSGTGANSIDYNHVPGRAYTDLSVRLRVKGGFELYGTINNLFDQDPPQAPTRTGPPFITFPTNGQLFDVVGRYFTIGAKIRL